MHIKYIDTSEHMSMQQFLQEVPADGPTALCPQDNGCHFLDRRHGYVNACYVKCLTFLDGKRIDSPESSYNGTSTGSYNWSKEAPTGGPTEAAMRASMGGATGLSHSLQAHLVPLPRADAAFLNVQLAFG